MAQHSGGALRAIKCTHRNSFAATGDLLMDLDIAAESALLWPVRNGTLIILNAMPTEKRRIEREWWISIDPALNTGNCAE